MEQQLVKFKIPSLHGMMTVAGFIVRVLDNGRIEVRTQQHGYFIIHPKEVICDGVTTFLPYLSKLDNAQSKVPFSDAERRAMARSA